MRATQFFGLMLMVPLGCAPATIRPSRAAKTTLELARSERCTPKGCRCRPSGYKETKVLSGAKRFEFRIPRTTSSVWVTIKDYGVFYKPAGTALPSCFVVDLYPGRHDIEVHSEGGDPEVGLQSGLTIYEYGEPEQSGGRPSWYRSFHFACGKDASACSRDEMDRWASFMKTLPRGVLDPCGSVMGKASGFSGSRRQKGDDAYRELTLRFALKIYKFKPHRASGSANCSHPNKNR